ncbi:MAG: thiamine phosphate synthase [Rhodospirillaceae bacterium]|nr:thiamine phosphate synthase [Rhodospirillaceae bacterium]
MTKLDSNSEVACQLYLITPPRIDEEELPQFLEKLENALKLGGVSCLQLRIKNPDNTPAPDMVIGQIAKMLVPLVQSYDVPVIMNDRPDLAAKYGCDGVHIGQEDTKYKEARALVGDKAIVGVTCHNSRHLAITASEAGADYVAFGSFYQTKTKSPKFYTNPSILQWWNEMTHIPCVAIGGITVKNCLPLIEAGADFLAVSASIWDHKESPSMAISEFNSAILNDGSSG